MTSLPERHTAEDDAMTAATLERIETLLLRSIETGARHDQLLQSIDQHLAKLNGKVAEHERWKQEHERDRAAQEAAAAVRRSWVDGFRPVAGWGAKALAWVCAAVLLYNARSVGQFMERLSERLFK